MAQDATNARYRAVVPGKAVVGKKNADRMAQTTLGGAVVPGKAILGAKAAREERKLREAQEAAKAADPKSQTGPAPKKDTKPKGDGKRDPRPVKPKPAPVPEGMTEEQAIQAVDADPNAWEKVLELETQRPDGARVRVLKAILDGAVPAATNPAVPAEVVAQLQAALVPDDDET